MEIRDAVKMFESKPHRIEEFLTKNKTKLYRVCDLCDIFKIQPSTIREIKFPEGYTTMYKKRKFYGNPFAISEFNKAMGIK